MVSLSNHACSAVSRGSVFVLRDPDARLKASRSKMMPKASRYT